MKGSDVFSAQALQGVMSPVRFCLQPIVGLALALCMVGIVGCRQRAHDELRGTWVAPPPQLGNSGEVRETWHIADGKIVRHAGPGGSFEEKWTYQLNVPERSGRPVQPTGGPNRIDLYPRVGPPRLGIYKVEDGILTICWARLTKTGRPKEFEEDSANYIEVITLGKTSDQPSVDMNAPGVEEELKGGRDDRELEGTWVEETKGWPDMRLDTWTFKAGKII